MTSVAVIDYGMGNLHSIEKALQYALPETEVLVTSEKKKIEQADRIVFPGVGAIRDCMLAIDAAGLSEIIKEVAISKPFLGICLGMQALLTESDENNITPCLNVFKGRVEHFPVGRIDEKGQPLKIPHMGWNQVYQHEHPLWQGIPQNSRFYFVHSYFVQPENTADTIATTKYTERFTSALAKNNIFAVQFHPEKSQEVGIQLLKNFLLWDGKV